MAAVLAFAPGAALAAGALDQQQSDDTAAGFAIATDQSLAQSFTAGVSGTLDSIALAMSQVGDPSGAVTVEIRNVIGDAPGATVLASASMPAASPPQFPAKSFVTIDFAQPAAISAGTTYAIVAYSANPVGDEHKWAGAHGNPYAGGTGFYAPEPSSPPTGPWLHLSVQGFDLAFKTYVTPPPPVTPTCGGKNATITGTAGNDTLAGTAGPDVIAGLGGNDKITGAAGNDLICGGDGNDSLDGGSGTDTLEGNAGADDLVGGSGLRDRCDGGSGTDSGGSGCETKISLP